MFVEVCVRLRIVQGVRFVQVLEKVCGVFRVLGNLFCCLRFFLEVLTIGDGAFREEDRVLIRWESPRPYLRCLCVGDVAVGRQFVHLVRQTRYIDERRKDGQCCDSQPGDRSHVARAAPQLHSCGSQAYRVCLGTVRGAHFAREEGTIMRHTAVGTLFCLQTCVRLPWKTGLGDYRPRDSWTSCVSSHTAPQETSEK